jgi:hypothetical protein
MQSLQGWQPHKANEKKQKDYGIMQKNKCKAIAKFAIYFLHPSGLIPFPFGFFITLATDCILNFIYYVSTFKYSISHHSSSLHLWCSFLRQYGSS